MVKDANGTKDTTDRIFRGVEFEYGRIHISGGHCSHPLPATSKTFTGSDNQQHVFVKLGVKEPWLLSCVCGSRCNSKAKAFGRTSLLDVLHMIVKRKCDGLDVPSDTQDMSVVGEDFDPMSELDRSSVTETQTPVTTLVVGRRTTGRSRYYQNMAKNSIVTVNLPTRCHEIDPSCKQMRPVKLFIVDRKSIWLSINDVPWAIRWLFDQHHLKGIPVVADDDAGPKAAVASPGCSN